MSEPLRLAVCENFRREMEAILADSPGLVDLVTFPARCSRPMLDWPTLECVLGESVDQEICILGGGCLRQLGPAPRQNWSIYAQAHCQALVAGTTLVESCLQEEAYLLTPGWLEHWRDHLALWGFDASGARAFFAETTQLLVLFDSGVLPGAGSMLQEMAQYLALPFRRIPVGLDHLRLFVGRLVDQRRAAARESEETARLARAHRQAADLLMVFDLVSTLTGVSEEREAIEKVMSLFTVLFAPSVLAFLDVVDGVAGKAKVEPSTAICDLEGLRRFSTSGEERQTVGSSGFQVRLAHLDATAGAILVDGVRFPEHRDHYLDLALTVGRVVGLAIANARAYGKLQRTITDLKAATDSVTVLEGLIPICMYCKKIRDDKGYWQAVERYVRKAPEAGFTHGVCAGCLEERFPEAPEPGSA